MAAWAITVCKCHAVHSVGVNNSKSLNEPGVETPLLWPMTQLNKNANITQANALEEPPIPFLKVDLSMLLL